MEERIKYLFRQYLENKCSRQELEEFFSYIRASGGDETLKSLIKKAYEETLQAPSSLTYVNEFGNLILTEKEWPSHTAREKKPLRRRLTAILAIAATLITIGTAVWLIHRTSRPKDTSPLATLTKKTTERSEYKYLLLPDSTQVWLNASSSLEFPDHFKPGKREVILSGEAYFDVKHADKSPFVIHTGKISTTVLGTAFNIKAYPDRENIIVSVSRGKVKVNYNNTLLATLI